jgi:hypothetical protein
LEFVLNLEFGIWNLKYNVMKKLVLSFFVFHFSFFTFHLSEAQIINVPGANNLTIQQGINEADPGDTVLVAEGIYNEQINFMGKKPLMVASGFLLDGDTNHISKTIITMSEFSNPDRASIVYFISGEDTTSVLCGFTITGGKGTIKYGNSDNLEGGGIRIYNSGARISSNKIHNNTVIDTLIENSHGTFGAAIFSVDSSGTSWVIIENNKIFENTCISNHDNSYSGGIYTLTNARIINNSIRNNKCIGLSDSTTTYGGGAACMSPLNLNLNVIVINNQITGNTVEPHLYKAYGGGFGTENTLLTFTNNTVSENKLNASVSGQFFGGGIYCCRLASGSSISNNNFSSNKTVTGWGGAMAIEQIMSWQVVGNNYYFNNSGRVGGAFYSTYCFLILQNNVFYKNSSSLSGGAVFLTGYDLPTMHSACLMNNSYSKNTSNNGGAIFTNLVNPIILNSIFWKDSAAIGAEIKGNCPLTEIAYCNIDTNLIFNPMTIIIGEGMINENPIFSDTLLNLSDISPGIDIGIDQYTCHSNTWESPLYDIDNLLRPWPDYFDMGAHEYGSVEVGVREFAVARSHFAVLVFPNPTSSISHFAFRIEQDQYVILKIYDIQGREVATVASGEMAAGEHTVHYDATGLPAGVYFYKLTVDSWQLAGGKLVKF